MPPQQGCGSDNRFWQLRRNATRQVEVQCRQIAVRILVVRLDGVADHLFSQVFRPFPTCKPQLKLDVPIQIRRHPIGHGEEEVVGMLSGVGNHQQVENIEYVEHDLQQQLIEAQQDMVNYEMIAEQWESEAAAQSSAAPAAPIGSCQGIAGPQAAARPGLAPVSEVAQAGMSNAVGLHFQQPMSAAGFQPLSS